MAAATKERRFQWNNGDKIENLIHCRANFNAQMDIGKSALMQTRLNSTRLSEKPWLAFMKKKRLSLGQRQVSLQFHHLVGFYCPKKLKIECHQKAKLREKQFAYFHDSCSRCHFDAPS